MRDFAPGLRVTTSYDEPPVALHLPGAIATGSAPELAVADMLRRHRRVVGRCRGPHSLLALRVANVRNGVRVLMSVSVDNATDETWAANARTTTPDYTATAVDLASLGRPPIHPDGTVRVVCFSSQGMLRAGSVLCRPARHDRRVFATASFDLGPTEVRERELVLIEVGTPVALAPWAVDLVRPLGTVGLRVESIRFSHPIGRPPGLVSLGTVARRAGAWSRLRRGLCVVNPALSGAAASWNLRAVAVRPQGRRPPTDEQVAATLEQLHERDLLVIDCCDLQTGEPVEIRTGWAGPLTGIALAPRQPLTHPVLVRLGVRRRALRGTPLAGGSLRWDVDDVTSAGPGSRP